MGGFGHGSTGQFVSGAVCSEEITVAGGGAAMSVMEEELRRHGGE